MKIGYPCINRTVSCTANSKFRLSNYSDDRLIETVENNLNCLNEILAYNVKNNLLFFRISSELIPFASHPVCKLDWQNRFKKKLVEIGDYIKENDMRISMHPDQFVVINSKDKDIVERSVNELKWHCEVLDLMGLDLRAKVQIHVGGVYGDKMSAIKRFISEYNLLPDLIKRRLAIENDDRLYSLKDCLDISAQINIPIIFDSFHHKCLNNDESMIDALKLASSTWAESDGILMSDYSSQEPGEKVGKHVTHIDIEDFKNYIDIAKEIDHDIMLEIKDKEISALEAVKLI